MWAEYNYSNFPIVNVNLVGQLKKDSDYYDFIRKWTLLYQKKIILNLFLIQQIVDM